MPKGSKKRPCLTPFMRETGLLSSGSGSAEPPIGRNKSIILFGGIALQITVAHTRHLYIRYIVRFFEPFDEPV